ncbi:unnamed protein product [Moneuplotes crassus]|uniref:Uncharacterized protein n=1 Tax=Euplotes crassus TaxID=5936 RepID=A0AAD1XA36_EUPCR|nr:unnamed protein product [Moneuplotes crassus]
MSAKGKPRGYREIQTLEHQSSVDNSDLINFGNAQFENDLLKGSRMINTSNSFEQIPTRGIAEKDIANTSKNKEISAKLLDNSSLLNAFNPQSRCESDFQYQTENTGDQNASYQRNFDTFNFKCMAQTREAPKNHMLLQDVIRQNLTHNTNRESKERNASMLNQNLTSDFESRSGEINKTAPVINPNLNTALPSWKTGVQRMHNFDISQDTYQAENLLHQMQENAFSRILARLDQFELRLSNTEEKMVLSKEILDLKYDEKKIEANLGQEDYNDLKKRTEILEKTVKNLTKNILTLENNNAKRLVNLSAGLEKVDANITKHNSQLETKIYKKIIPKLTEKLAAYEPFKKKIPEIDTKMVDICDTMEGIVHTIKETSEKIKAEFDQKIQSVQKDCEIFSTKNSEIFSKIHELECENAKVLSQLKKFYMYQYDKFNTTQKDEGSQSDEEESESQEEQENIAPNLTKFTQLKSKALLDLLKSNGMQAQISKNGKFGFKKIDNKFQ